MIENQNNKIVRKLYFFGIAVLFIVASSALYRANLRYKERQQELKRLNEILDQKRIEHAKLLTEVNGLTSDPAVIEKVAREKFQFCKDGEVILLYDVKTGKP